MRRFQERAVDLVTGPDARKAFDLEQEPVQVRDRYGRWPLGQNLLLARRLIEAGVRLVSVTAWTGLPPGEKFRNVQTWDMHGNGAGLGSIFGTGHFGLGWALPRLDEAVSALLEDLEVRGLLETTLVVDGRRVRPQPADQRPAATTGPPATRPCWPAPASAAAWSTARRTRSGGYVRDNPVSPENFGATLFHALGVPPETRLGADGFTNPASAGQPIEALFG